MLAKLFNDIICPDMRLNITLAVLLLALLAVNGRVLAGNWQRNTYPGQGFVDHGQPAGAGCRFVQWTVGQVFPV